MRRWQIVLLALCGIFLGRSYARACGCVVPKPPACQEAWRASAVFAGTVLRTETVSDEQQFPWIKVRFAVTEWFTGPSPKTNEIEVLTPQGRPACGFYFETQRSYLVYANRTPDGILRTSHCSRTAAIEKAAADLAYLRSLPTLPSAGQLFGWAYDSQAHTASSRTPLPWSPVSGVQIAIHSQKVRKTEATDADGHFAFSDLPPGSYTITASKPGYWAGNSIAVSVPTRGCSETYFNLNVNRAIAGRLFDQFGHPAPHVTVELIRTTDKFGYLNATSDADGHYEFRRLPPGDYYLGVNLSPQPLPDNPYQRWYYPGVSNITQSTPLAVNETPGTLTVDLTLPEAQREVTVNGIVEWSDGRPASHAEVFPEDTDFPHQLGMIRIPTDGNGRFQAKLFDQTTYRLHAAKHEASSHDAYAEPVTIVPGQLKQGTTIRLILSRSQEK